MYISGKVTHSVLTLLAKKSVDIEPLFEYTDLPAEFLRDPSCWLEAAKVESFLALLEQQFVDLFPSESLIENVAHSNHTLKTWGVLDSVLKMMLDPQDIFMQPQRFISYFVSPAPAILNVERTTHKISFETPINNLDFPFLTMYLKSILEVLPCFMGKEFASAYWEQNQVTVDWSSQQESLFASNDEALNLNPENLKNLVSELESKNREISNQFEMGRLKDLEIDRLKQVISRMKTQSIVKSGANLVEQGLPNLNEFEKFVSAPLSNIQTQIFKLSDYLTRAQQLITLLVGQNRLDKQVKVAMKRVDWEYVRGRFTHTVQDGVNNIDSIRREIESLKRQYDEVDSEEMSLSDLDAVIDREVSTLSMKLRTRQIYIDRMLFFGREIFINKQSLKSFFQKTFDFVTEQMQDKGYIRIMSRPRPQFAEVEIVDNGSGINKQKIEVLLKDPVVGSVLKEHKATMQLIKASPEGSTLLIQIPSIGALDVKSKTHSSQRNLR